VELGVCHDLSAVRDSLGCLKEVHTICYSLAYFPTWEADVGIWIVEGVILLLKVKTPHWNIGQIVVGGKLQRPCMMWSFPKHNLWSQKLIFLLLVQMRWPLLMHNNGLVSMGMWCRIKNVFLFYWPLTRLRWVQLQTTLRVWRGPYKFRHGFQVDLPWMWWWFSPLKAFGLGWLLKQRSILPHFSLMCTVWHIKPIWLSWFWASYPWLCTLKVCYNPCMPFFHTVQKRCWNLWTLQRHWKQSAWNCYGI
jgi:hypothetical protein